MRAGFAWWYVQYAKHDVDLAELEEQAREAKRGLWIDVDPTPPWEWKAEVIVNDSTALDGLRRRDVR